MYLLINNYLLIDNQYCRALTDIVTSYTQNGILHMLDRNRRIKGHPERFQDCPKHFDLIITCEERVYDQVLDG